MNRISLKKLEILAKKEIMTYSRLEKIFKGVLNGRESYIGRLE